MSRTHHTFALGVAMCFMLAACVQTGAQKNDVLNIYELPRAAPGQAMPVDNDSYYTQPTVYKGCAQIGDAPSCGGG